MSKKKKNIEKLLGKFAKDKKVNKSDKYNFISKVLGKIGLEDAKIVFHIATQPKCAKKVFSNTDIALIIAAVAYVIIPVDAIPDFLPPGLLDDIFVMSGVIGRYYHLLKKYKDICMD